MNSSCDTPSVDGTGPFVIINKFGDVLQPDGTWGELARSFHDVASARAARPNPDSDRVIFQSQRKKWGECQTCRI